MVFVNGSSFALKCSQALLEKRSGLTGKPDASCAWPTKSSSQGFSSMWSSAMTSTSTSEPRTALPEDSVSHPHHLLVRVRP